MTHRKKIIEGLLRNMHVMRHKMMLGYGMKKTITITPSQGCVLRFVEEHPSSKVKTIAQALHITSSAATQLIDSLTQKGYLLRKENPKDRRVSSVSLSAKAKNQFKAFRTATLKQMTQLFKALSDEELIQYAQLNQKIIHNLSDKI